MKVIVQALLLLLASTTISGAAATDRAATFSAILTYPSESRSDEISGFFRSHGKAYRLRLYPELDADGVLGDFTLTMEDAGSSWRGRNFLEPTRMWHGYQPFFFAASDFEHGAAKSIFGNPRTIELPRLGMAVQVTIVRVVVIPVSTTAHSPEFKNLTLRIVARPVQV
jgi:hypothetical protein